MLETRNWRGYAPVFEAVTPCSYQGSSTHSITSLSQDELFFESCAPRSSQKITHWSYAHSAIRLIRPVGKGYRVKEEKALVGAPNQ